MGRRVPEAKPIPVKTSSFHITINTNQRYPTAASMALDMRPFWEAIEAAFGGADGLRQVVEVMNGADSFDSNVHDVEVNSGMEYSPKSGLHAHVLLTVEHTTKVRVNLAGLRGILDEKLTHLAGKKYHLYVRFVPNQVAAVRNYIYKTYNGGRYRLFEGSRSFSGPMVCKCTQKIGDMSTFW
jgi:hypothetical protein